MSSNENIGVQDILGVILTKSDGKVILPIVSVPKATVKITEEFLQKFVEGNENDE